MGRSCGKGKVDYGGKKRGLMENRGLQVLYVCFKCGRERSKDRQYVQTFCIFCKFILLVKVDSQGLYLWVFMFFGCFWDQLIGSFGRRQGREEREVGVFSFFDGVVFGWLFFVGCFFYFIIVIVFFKVFFFIFVICYLLLNLKV